MLIAWSHNYLPLLRRALMLDDSVVPSVWPEDRFDLVWIFDMHRDDWHFSQTPQMLLAGDRPDALV